MTKIQVFEMKVKNFNLISINKVKSILNNVSPDLYITRESINKLQVILKKILFKILLNIQSKKHLNENDLSNSLKKTFESDNNTLYIHSNNYAVKTLNVFFANKSNRL